MDHRSGRIDSTALTVTTVERRPWRIRTVGRLLVMAGLGLGGSGCQRDPFDPPEVLAKLSMEPSTSGWRGFNDVVVVSVYRGTGSTNQAFGGVNAGFEEVSDVGIRMESSNPKVVRVISVSIAPHQVATAHVEYVGVGTAVLTARIDDSRFDLVPGANEAVHTTVTVSEPPKSIHLSPTSATLGFDQSLSMAITAKTASGALVNTTNAGRVRLGCVDDLLCGVTGVAGGVRGDHVLGLPMFGIGLGATITVKATRVPGTVTVRVELVGVDWSTGSGLETVVASSDAVITVVGSSLVREPDR